ncbi:MAG: helix-turn-helix domain-containing protein [Flavonifractor plautii]|nr:helix-turn-helix domain-containing protein [Flavonifractor plautii]MDU6289774.1 helix-turn-helix domain-containing protein [Flavonifractor plautii]MDU6342355.1 helix-turn-helix domain-containing protein [Flavonifractor plautii]
MDTVDRIFGLLDKMPIEQQEFAKLVGVSDDTASNWRRRKSASYSKYLSKIADVLGTTVEYLLTGKKERPAPTPKNGDELDRDTIMAAFIGGDMDMSPEERDALWDDVYEYARFKAEQWRKKKDQE